MMLSRDYQQQDERMVNYLSVVMKLMREEDINDATVINLLFFILLLFVSLFFTQDYLNHQMLYHLWRSNH